MQMTDNNRSKVEIKSSSSKLWVVYIMLVLGVGILVALYINFQLTYKVDDINQKISKLDSNQKKANDFSKNSSPIKKDIPSTKKVINSQPKEKEPLSDPYLTLYNFIQDFYIMKERAEKGEDFTIQLLDLKRYTILSDELKQHLNRLLNLAPNNKKKDYFKLSFNKIIRTLYQRTHDSSFFNINDYIFIRPIGERAIENGGIDQQIVLIEQALIQNNLQKVDDHLQNLPKDLKSLTIYKSNVKNKLEIQDRLSQIEAILLNKQNSNIVS